LGGKWGEVKGRHPALSIYAPALAAFARPGTITSFSVAILVAAEVMTVVTYLRDRGQHAR